MIVDTAGRLHNKSNLMAELDKMTHLVTDASPHAHLIVNDERDLGDLACDVMRLAGWIDDQGRE